MLVSWTWKNRNLLNGIASLSRHEQAEKAGGTIRCRGYNSPPVDVPYEQVRLILDPQITQGVHSETILEPADRQYLAGMLRDFVDGAEVSGVQIRLASVLVDAASLSREGVAFPALRVRDQGDTERVIPSPLPVSKEVLRNRGRQRTEAVRRFGYLQGRPINPTLAWPRRFVQQRAKRMASDLNCLLSNAGV